MIRILCRVLGWSRCRAWLSVLGCLRSLTGVFGCRRPWGARERTQARRSPRSWLAWSPGPIRSTISGLIRHGALPGLFAGFGRPRRLARSFGGLPGETSVSLMRCPRDADRSVWPDTGVGGCGGVRVPGGGSYHQPGVRLAETGRRVRLHPRPALRLRPVARELSGLGPPALCLRAPELETAFTTEIAASHDTTTRSPPTLTWRVAGYRPVTPDYGITNAYDPGLLP